MSWERLSTLGVNVAVSSKPRATSHFYVNPSCTYFMNLWIASCNDVTFRLVQSDATFTLINAVPTAMTAWAWLVFTD